MEISLGYGKEIKYINIPVKNLLGVLKPNDVKLGKTGEDEVRRALENPIGTLRLGDLVSKGEKIVIITSDITRPMPTKKVLPFILKELMEKGISYDDITIVLALGVHRKHSDDEKRYLLGDDVFNKIQCLDSDVNDCVMIGKTSKGTPVNVFRAVVEADRRICLGNIEYHYFAGYSGGAKAILPGVCTKETIQANHSMMVKPGSKAGELEDNPVRMDIDEVGKLINIDFIFNVVLDEKKNIIKAVAGDYIEAHRVGCAFLDKFYKVEINALADVVIVSVGGYPKDINLYQAQKGLDNAKHAVKAGGTIILLASCKEGLGEQTFERWMTTSNSPNEMIENIQTNFELGGHKAAAIAMVLKNSRIFLVSDLEDEFVKSIFLEPYKTIEEAIESSYKNYGENMKVLVMPYSGSTLPLYNAKKDLKAKKEQKNSFLDNEPLQKVIPNSDLKF